MMIRVASAVLALALLPAAAPVGPEQRLPSPFAGAVRPLPSPAGPGSAEPNLTVGPDGTVWLSWLEPRAEGGHRFRLAARHDDSWSAPITIAEGEDFFVNWADFPSVFVSTDGRMAAHWLERSAAARYAYGVRMSTSDDGGRTWTSPTIPHRDESPTEHGFVSFFETPGGSVGLVWLDGRAMIGPEGRPADGSMTLRSTTIGHDGLEAERLVDDRVCDCCQTSAARTGDGVIVAYRDRSDDEIRDISVARLEAGGWSAPVTVHQDNWRIRACPVNGPAVVADGDDVAVAWFTAAGGGPRTLLAFSTDGGRSFDAPVRLDIDPSLGRVGMVMLDGGRVLVSSLEGQGDGGRIVIREARRDGHVGEAVTVAPASTARSSGFARLALSGSRLTVAWTDVEDGRPIGVAVAEIDIQKVER